MLGKRTRIQSIVPYPTTCFISDWTAHTLTLAEQPSTSRDSKMSHVVFYTVLGDGQHSLSPKTPANTCGFALNRSGTFTCKRLGSLPKKPSLLVIAEQGRTFVLEIDQALFGDYFSAGLHQKARRECRQDAANRFSHVYSVGKALCETQLDCKSSPGRKRFFQLEDYLKVLSRLKGRKVKQAPAKSENSSLVRALFVQIRKLTHALGQLTAMQKALAASSVDLPQDDELEEVKQALQNRLTDLYSLDFTRYFCVPGYRYTGTAARVLQKLHEIDHSPQDHRRIP